MAMMIIINDYDDDKAATLRTLVCSVQADFRVQMFGNTRVLHLMPDVQRAASTGHLD